MVVFVYEHIAVMHEHSRLGSKRVDLAVYDPVTAWRLLRVSNHQPRIGTSSAPKGCECNTDDRQEREEKGDVHVTIYEDQCTFQ